ncbi:MAG: hypothetical protein LUD07_05505 [Clostridiales bacterium]|nr:hypothetical protein [Clostridiales bacterium]
MRKKMILASHGRLAEGIVNAMQMVIGATGDLQYFGLMPGEDPEMITEAVERMLKAEPENQYLILVDIRGGSVSNSITRLAAYEQVKLIQGMNLPAVIGLYLTDGILDDDAIEEILVEARNGLCMMAEDRSLDWEDEEII